MQYWLPYAQAANIYGLKLMSSGAFVSNPTLATGDVKITKDGGALANLATLPDVLPTSSAEVHLTLSSSETQCRIATINFIDVTGAEWEDKSIDIFTYGHPSAFFPFDFSTAGVSLTQQQVTQLIDSVWAAPRTEHQVLGSFGAGVNLNSVERSAIATAILDEADTIETGVALRGALRLILASAAGTLSGADTNTIVLNNAVANTKPRITATVSNNGNRLAIVYDMS